MKFEQLPDEILMLIFQHINDAHNCLRIFLGLNQRLNKILLDSRSGLIMQLFGIHICQNDFQHYYDSTEFIEIITAIQLMKNSEDDIQLKHYLQKLLCFHIRKQHDLLQLEFHEKRIEFQKIRDSLSTNEIMERDRQLRIAFETLASSKCPLRNLKILLDKASSTGARLVCEHHELIGRNLADVLQEFLLAFNNHLRSAPSAKHRIFLRLMKTLIVSNPDLIFNRGYVGNGGWPCYSFVLYRMYTLCDFYSSYRIPSSDPEHYHTMVQLYLFITQCFHENDDFKIFELVPIMINHAASMNDVVKHDLIVQVAQNEFLRRLCKKYPEGNHVPDEFFSESFSHGFRRLVKNSRHDLIEVLCTSKHFSEFIFRNDRSFHKCINAMTSGKIGRRILSHLFDLKPYLSWINIKRLLFILLQKKECELVRKLIRSIPFLINITDEKGNNPLLFLCLEVGGCRHRLVEFLIQSGCNCQQTNLNHENFFIALSYRTNRKLLLKLLDHECILPNENDQEPRFHWNFSSRDDQ